MLLNYIVLIVGVILFPPFWKLAAVAATALCELIYRRRTGHPSKVTKEESIILFGVMSLALLIQALI